MRRLAFLLILVPTLVDAAERAPEPGVALVPDWVLVRTERPLVDKAPDGSFSLRTPFAELNSVIEARGISRIEPALPFSVQVSGSPAARSRHGLDRLYRFHVAGGTDIRELARTLSAAVGVEWAEPDFIRRPARVLPDDPMFLDQWGLDQASDADVDAPEGWQVSTGEKVIVAVIDTGVDMSHEDLADNFCEGCGLPEGPCWDFVDGDSWPEDYVGGSYSGHGTNSASIIAGVTNNGLGVAGICWSCCVVPLRIWDQHGDFGSASMIADAVVWATDHGARVINLSGGGDPGPFLTELSAIAYAADAGVIFVSVTGNEGDDSVFFPARYAEAIAVGATDQQDWRAGFSNHADEIDVVAPGVDILSADLDDMYLHWNGTSLAAPFVSGVIGLVSSVSPSVGREEARHLVRSGAEDELGDSAEDVPGFDEYHGFGRINMERTLLATTSSTSLRVEGKQSTRLFLETPNPVADSYDFVRGDLAMLSESSMGVALGRVLCLEDDSTDPDTVGGNEDEGVPPVGEAYFYLARFNSAAGVGSYGGSSENRDRFATGWDWVEAGDQSGDRFGFSVDTAGDVNADGYADVIVGAYFHDGDLSNEGAAFVYHGSPDGLDTTTAWFARGNQADAWFGTSVASAGDVNGDGFDDVIVGAVRHDNSKTNEGRAYVYLGSESGLAATPAWTTDGGQADALLGFRVGGAGDVDGDGYDDVIVAARRHDNPQLDEGRAYLFRGSAGGLSDTPRWTFETNQAGAQVTSVATAGDVNCDGFDDVIVGSMRFDNGETDEGRVFVFHGSSTGLSSPPSATLEIDVPGAEFGFSVAAAGDVDGAGCDDVIVGAHLYANGENAEGAALVYLGWPSGLSTTPAWSFESDEPEARAGQIARGVGDVNGDSYDDVIVGGGSFGLLESYHAGSRTDEGKVWLFFGSAAGVSSTPDWSDVGRQTGAFYGWAAAPAGNVNGDPFDDIVVGAYGHDGVDTDEGRAYLLQGPLTSTDCRFEMP